VKETLIELQSVLVLRHTDPTGLFGLWGTKPVRAVDGVNLALRSGETLGLIGGSGGGKSTLAETVTLRQQTSRGRILFQGQDASKLRGGARKKAQRRLQIIRQDARENLEMDRTVRKQLQDHLREYQLPDSEGRIKRAMSQVELDDSMLDRTPREISGGQQQRLAIARALSVNPLLIAADEPVGGVDPRLRLELLGLFERVQREQGLAMLIISQDLKVIRRLAHQTAVMHAGQIYELGPTDQVLDQPLHPYSRLFLGADQGAMPPEEDAVGKGTVGCPWAAYCPLAMDRCRQEVPGLREVAPGQMAACHALQ